ncbi:MAG: sensor histidine kinase [Spirochaetaceae bacterium]
MKTEDSIALLSRRLVRTVAFVVLPVLAVLTTAVYVPVAIVLTNAAYERFQQDVRLAAATTSSRIDQFAGAVDSLASRTVIRQRLYDYTQGITDFQDLTAYTEPRYADGASVITSLSGARRILPDGRIVATFGDQMHLRMSASSDRMRVEQNDARTVIVIRRPIRQERETIGYDIGAFDTSLLQEDLAQSLAAVYIHDTLTPGTDFENDRNTHTLALNGTELYLTGVIKPSFIRDTRRQVLQRTILYVLATAFVVLFLLRLTLFRFIRNLISKLSKASSDKDLLLRESHHRIKNNFAVVESFLHLQSTTAPNPETSDALRTASSRVSNMRLLYERLLETDAHTTVSARSYLQQLSEHVVNVYQDEHRIGLTTDIDDLSLDAERGFALGAIVTELLTNCCKHGYDKGASGTVSVYLSRTDLHAVLTICDDGRGLPSDIDVADSDSFGLTVVRMLAEQLGGTFTSDTQPAGQGTCFRVVFPVAPPKSR